MFQDCSGLTSVTIPNSVISIGYKAFYNCSNLRTFTIPNNVTSIGESALQNCSGLYSITIPNSVTSIGNKAFYGCDLSEVISDIENPFYINTNTFFDNISYNATLYIPKGTMDKYHAAGGGWSKFGKTVVAYYDIAIENADGVTIYYNYINDKKELEVTCKIHPEDTNFRSYSDAVVIPEEVTYMDKTLKVTSIGYLAFCNCSRLTSITIPNSVTSIGIEAFRTCQRLRYVHISDLESWCKIAFSRASSNPLCYAHHLFLNGEEIKDLVIPNSVTSIGDYAFYGCSGLTSITIPNSVTSIGYRAFNNCSALTAIQVEDGNTVYDSRNDCNAIIETTSNTLLFGCQNTIIPNDVVTIGECAFWGCSPLTAITIPNSVTSIGRCAFTNCSGLTSISMPNSVTSIDYCAFSDCRNLATVIIGNALTNIGEGAFIRCSHLKDMYCYAEQIPELGNNVFDYSHYNATLHVPEVSLEAYNTTEQWMDFGIIVALTDSDPQPTGIKGVNDDVMTPQSYYSSDGKRIAAPQRGLNIVRMSDGTTKKVINK